MTNGILSDSEGFSIVTLFLIGSSIILGSALQAKNDSWVSTLIGMFFSIFLIYVLAKLLYFFPGKDLFQILNIVFGKFFGSLFSILYTWYFFHLGSLVLRNFGEFMNTLAFPETPMLFPILCMIILCIWVSKYGIYILGRCSKLLLFISLIVLIIIQLLAIHQMHLNYLKPILGNKSNQILSGAFSAFSFPFAELITLIGIPFSLKKRTSPYKILFTGLALGGTIIVVITLRNILILGHNVISLFYFISYTAVGRIKVGNFLERMDVTVAIVFVNAIFVKTSVCLMAASNGIGRIFNLKSYKSVVLQVGLIMSYLSYFIYKSTMEMQFWAVEIYRYYAFPFQVIIPILTIIILKIKIKKKIIVIQ